MIFLSIFFFFAFISPTPFSPRQDFHCPPPLIFSSFFDACRFFADALAAPAPDAMRDAPFSPTRFAEVYAYAAIRMPMMRCRATRCRADAAAAAMLLLHLRAFCRARAPMLLRRSAAPPAPARASAADCRQRFIQLFFSLPIIISPPFH
jgi:hypothetical protein